MQVGKNRALRFRHALGGAALAGVLGMVGLSAGGTVAEGRRPAASLGPATVVADLAGPGTLPEGVRRALADHRARPDMPQAALDAARALIGEARRTGNGRLSGAALTVLQDRVAAADPAGIYLAAVARQQQHDFAGALRLLDGLLAGDPGHLDARLLRATLRLVQGDLPAARDDCRALTELAPAPGFLCLSSTYTLAPEGPDVARELTRLLQTPGGVEGALRVWALSLAGEIAWMQGDARGAEQALRAALTLDPAGQREAVMLADVLLAGGRADEVPPLLSAYPATDAIALRRLRAAAAGASLDRAETAAARRALTTRVAEAQSLGLSAHAREEGQFLLWIEGDAKGALQRAEANWQNQKEFDDAVLFLQAAAAAGQPDRAQPVHDWIARAGLTAPALMLRLPGPNSPQTPAPKGDLP